MDSKKAAYTRGPETRGQDLAYEQKFSNLVKACTEAKGQGIQGIVVRWPWIIGDTYEEIIKSLSVIADAGLVLHVVESEPPSVSRN
jgi:hypothetical protein